MTNKVTFIVGAGASAELNIPSGDGLKKDIARALSFEFNEFGKLAGGDKSVRLAIKTLVERKQFDYQRLVQAADHIVSAIVHQPSIDTFIDSQRHIPEVAVCGKIAITAMILKHEGRSKIRHKDWRSANQPINFDEDDHYLHYLFQIMADSRDLTEFREKMESVSFIVFNYDRCIEHYFFQAIRNLYKVGPDEAADIVDDFEIVHPYGYCGSLPKWPNRGGIEFGSEISPQQLIDLSERIRTFTEQIDDSAELDQVRHPIANAKKLIFLGFGFHHQNLELLLPTGEKKAGPIYGSGYGMSGPDIEHVKTRLSAFQRHPGLTINIDPELKASEFLTNYKVIAGS